LFNIRRAAIVGAYGKKKKPVSRVPPERIERSIISVRGQRVILDADLASLSGVMTARLNQQVRRNSDRFPDGFAFQLSKQEFDDLKLHFATSSSGWGGRRKPPIAFTEHGALMAANVLKSPQAVETNVQVVRTFVRLREMLVAHKDLARRLAELEQRYDAQFKVVFDAIRQLMTPPPTSRRNIGFRASSD